MEIQEGEIYGFIGPNGAGKSTTIKLILNLLKKDSGSITINGKDSVESYVQNLNDIGYLPSELHYYDKMKSIQLLKYSEKFYKKNCEKKRNYLAKTLEIDLNSKINSLSLGNKKKIGIIDALQHDPSLIILDEPSSGLDPLMQNKLFDLLLEEKNKGKTILFSSHNLNEVQKICDKVCIIKDGKILSVETIKDNRQKNLKEITLNLKNIEDIEKIKQKKYPNTTINNNEVSFLIDENSNKLLMELQQYELNDITITKPNLEKLFLHYYD